MKLFSTVWPTVHTNPSRKRSFISTVRPTVHTYPSRNRSFISTVRTTVHTNPSQKRSFSKTLLKPEEFENAGFSFWSGRKTLRKQLVFWKRRPYEKHAIYTCDVFSNTNLKWPVTIQISPEYCGRGLKTTRITKASKNTCSSNRLTSETSTLIMSPPPLAFSPSPPPPFMPFWQRWVNEKRFLY